MACAQTGSGKTAAFLFPMINTLLGSRPPGKDGMQSTPQVVIMAPTRELVIQIYDEARKFCGGTDLSCCLLYGGTSVQEQLHTLGRGCNILAATPGRVFSRTIKLMLERQKSSIYQHVMLFECAKITPYQQDMSH